MLKYFSGLMFVVLCAVQAQAQTTVTFSPTNDAFVLSETSPNNYTSTNYGTDPRLLVSRWTNGPAYSTRSYMKFDVSSIPTSATICSAVLTVYTTSDNNPSGYNRPNSSYLRRVTATWSQSTITWSNQPAFSATDTIPFGPVTVATGSSYTINVLSHIQNMVSSPSANYGWAITLKNETNTYAGLGLASSDYTNTAMRPFLTVTYAPSITGTTPASRCGTGTLSLGATANAGTINWYAAATGGSSLGTGTAFTTPSISSTTTYYVDATYGGCTSPSRTSVVATVNALPTITATSSTASICAGKSATLTAGGGSTYAWSPAGSLSSSTGATVSASPSVTTTYTVTGTNASGCVNTKTVTLNVNALPVLTISPASPTICAGSTTTLTAGGASTYSWAPSAGLSATSGATVAANPTVTTTYTLTGTNASGCVSTKTVSITVNAIPAGEVDGPPLVCNRGTSTFTASGASTYSWIPSTNLSATTGSLVTFTPGAADSTGGTGYTYSVVCIGANGCTDTTILSFLVRFTHTITVNSAAICTGGSATLTTNGTNNIFSWSPATGLSSTTTASVVANPSVTTTYTVVGSYNCGGHCIQSCGATTTSTVTVNALPALTITPSSATICSGSSTTLTASGASTYTWSPGTGLSATTGATVSANPSSSIVYTVTGTNSSGCVSTKTVSVTVNASPTLTVSASSASICAGSSSTLTASGATTYSWSPGTGLSATTGATVSANPSSSTVYSVTGTNGSGCVNTKTISITVNSVPTLSLSPASPSICTGSSGTLTASGASTYSWSPATGLSATSGTTVSANPSSTTSYTLTGTTSGGCVSTKAFTVTVNTSPTLTVSPSTTICAGSSSTLTASGASTYSWSPGTGLSSTSGATVSANPSSNTVYTVTGTNAGGCSNTKTISVTVNHPSMMVWASPTSICAGGTTTLNANGASTYAWSPPSGLGATTGATVTASPSVTTTYTVTGTNSSGCVSTGTAIVTVNANPSVSIATSPSTIVCAGTSATLTASGAGSYNWAPSTGLSSSSGATVVSTPSANMVYTVTGTSGSCSGTATIALTYTNTTVTAHAGGPVLVLSGSTITIGGSPTATGGASPYTYAWLPNQYLNSNTAANPVSTPTANVIYTLTVTDHNGCKGTDNVQVLTQVFSYAVLSKRMDGGYYQAQNNMLYFKYNEEYTNNTSTLNYKIYNDKNVQISCTSFSPGATKLGNNVYGINLSSQCVSVTAGYYTLEVVNEKNERFILKFKV